MAKKRPEFSFPELEHRGRNAILRSSAEVQAEEALLAEAGGNASATDASEATPTDAQARSPSSTEAVTPRPRRTTTPSSDPAPAEHEVSRPEVSPHEVSSDASPAARASTPASVRARTHVPKSGGSAGSSSVVTDRLRQKLRTKQHLSSYTFRFRPEELEQLDQLVTALNLTRSTKLSKNDLVRLALGWLLTDYEEYGPESLVVEVTRHE